MSWLVPVCFLVLAAFSAVSSFSWQDCGPATNAIKIQDLGVRRKGDIFYLSFKDIVKENLTEPIEAKVKVMKKFPFSNEYFEIPCINGLGSCDYKDVCNLSPWEAEPCPDDFIKNNIPCTCPIPKNHYVAKDLEINYDGLPPDVRGTYKVKMNLYKNGTELLCLKMKMKL